MYVEQLNFIRKNQGACIAFAVIIAVCIAGIWFMRDAARNEELYDSTDRTVERIEAANQHVRDEITGSTGAVANAETSVRRTEDLITAGAGTVAAGTDRSEEIADGIARCEDALTECRQSLGRVRNIIEDIENANRKGKAGAPSAAVAK